LVSRNKYGISSLLLTFFVLLFFGPGCTQRDSPPIAEDVFARALGEMMIINRLSVPDSVKTALVQNLFQKEEISEKEFLTTKAKFKQDEVFWQRIYRKAEAHIREMEKELQKKRLKK